MESSSRNKITGVPTGMTLRMEARLGGPAYSFSWSPDGKFFSAHNQKNLRIWDAQTTTLHRRLSSGKQITGPAVWLLQGEAIAVTQQYGGDIQIWDSRTGKSIQTLPSLSTRDEVRSFALAYSHTSDTLFYAQDGRAATWNAKSKAYSPADRLQGSEPTFSPDGTTITTLVGKNLVLKSISSNEEHKIQLPKSRDPGFDWSRDSTLLVVAVNDSLLVVDTAQHKIIHRLESHTSSISSSSFSADGRLMASAAYEGEVILWRCDTWQPIATLHATLGTSSINRIGIVFHPTQSLLAILNFMTGELQVWHLDLAVMLGQNPAPTAVRYTTAKIALVGDSGVGKTGLGWRLAHGEYKQQSSTHGEQLWNLDDLRTLRSDGTQCEAVLWDFAGQPDYRLIHALFLDDADLALLVFDPSNRQEALKGVEYWLKALSHRQGGPCRSILVGARVDVGPSTLTAEELDAFCRHHGISGGYIPTSALKGEGIEGLLARVREQVAWDEKPSTVTTHVFKAIRDSLLRVRENVQGADESGPALRLLAPNELRDQVVRKIPELRFNDEELMVAVGHLARHGHVKVLRRSTGEQVILLEPHLLNNLAASLVLEARRNNKGLGALQEDRLLRGEYAFPELASLVPQEQQTLLDAAVVLFLEKNICFRETLGSETLLVFPALINQKKPHVAELATVDDVSYTVTGAVQNVYAALVVLLGYTNTFTRTDQWQNQAQYEVGPDEFCGFRQVAESEGEIELVLYYGRNVPAYARLLFQGLFEKILSGRGVTVSRYAPVSCPKCAYRPARSEVIHRVRQGKDFLFCGDCAEKLSLPRMTPELTTTTSAPGQLAQDEEAAQRRTAFESALTRVKRLTIERKRKGPPTCFISYAWGESEHERWVEKRLASDLRNAGIQVVLDRWHNASLSSNIARFLDTISECDFVVVVGTPLYKKKYANKLSSTGTTVAAEMDLINQRLTGTEVIKRSVIPLLLDGEKKISLPPLMRGRVHGDFRQESSYFAQLLDLILTLYGISFEEPAVIDLRDTLRPSTREQDRAHM